MLASCSSSVVHVWDINNADKPHLSIPYLRNACTIDWSSDRTEFCVGGGKSSPFITNLYDDSSPISIPLNHASVQIRSVAHMLFDHSNNVLLNPSNSLDLYIWDRTEQTYRGPKNYSLFKSTSENLNDEEIITAICKDPVYPKLLYAATSKARILTWNLSTDLVQAKRIPRDVGSEPDLLDMPLCFTSISSSRFRKSLLACGDDEGNLTLVDSNEGGIIYRFEKSHDSAVQSAQFSPLNKTLMASVGLDCCVKLYDIGKQKIIKKIQTNEPLKSFSFHKDGVTLVVGCESGSILIYDLRAPLNSTFVINNLHQEAVTQIKFQSQSSSEDDPVGLIRSSIMRVKSTEQMSDRGRLFVEAFSPVKGDDPLIINNQEIKRSKTSTSQAESRVQDENEASFWDERVKGGIHTTLLENVKYHHQTTPLQNKLHRHQSVESFRVSQSRRSAAEWLVGGGISSTGKKRPVEETTTATARETTTREATAMETTTREITENPTTAELSALQLKIITDVIEEKVTEAKEELTKEIQSLQVEMIRQFFKQKLEYEKLLKEHGGTRALQDELAKLREENRRLRARVAEIINENE